MMTTKFYACMALAALGALSANLPAADTTALRARVMRLLPAGSVVAEGALREDLIRQRDGLTGHAEELYADIGRSDWLTNAGKGGEFAWERGPYFARGLVALAFALDDPDLKAKARRWIDAVLDAQLPNGDFGPRRHNWWANMLPLWYLRDWADATGDARVVPFLERYFRFQQKEFAVCDLSGDSCWPVARAGDELDAVYWLYDKTQKAEWLAFADELIRQSADWTTYYHVGGKPGRGSSGAARAAISALGYRSHIVNFMQGLKFPALKWRRSGAEADREAYAAAFDPEGWVMRRCGRPDAMVNGSEPLTDRSASGGTELCAIAERIISIPFALGASGSARFGDDLEDVGYNALPATVSPDGKGIRYYLLLNQPSCQDGSLLFNNNGFGAECTGAICPGPHSGFGCCRSNWHVALPKFVAAMWMRCEKGLAVVAHGPARVTADLPGGRVVFRADTAYPYSNRVTLRVVSGGGAFPLFVRIPSWARCDDAGTFRRYERTWKTGDAITLDFPMETTCVPCGDGAVAVRRGPLLYAFAPKHEMRKVAKYKVPYENRFETDCGGAFPRWEILAQEPWNYVLELRDGKPVVVNEVGTKSAPEVCVRARRTAVEGWGEMRSDAWARAVDPPFSPVKASLCSSESETLRLVPLAKTQVRITIFPWTSAQP